MRTVKVESSSRKRLWLLAVLSLFLFLQPITGVAITPEQLRSRLRVKFRRTSSILLQARLFPVQQPADSSSLTLAYRYPDKFLQILRGRRNRKQVMLFRGDSVAVYYPELDILKERRLSPAQKSKLIARNVPLAAVVGGLQSDSFPLENIRVETYGETVSVEINNDRPELSYRQLRAVFRRESLTPLFFVIISDYKYRLEVDSYEEENRFPPVIEKAFGRFDPRLLEGWNNG